VTMPLTAVNKGEKAVLLTVTGGRQLRGRLAALGLLPGTEVQVVQNSGQGPFIVSVRGSRIVLGRGMAARMEVE